MTTIDKIDNYTKDTHTFFDYFCLKTKKAFKLTDANKQLIAKKLKEGYTIDDLKKATDNFVRDDWPERVNRLDLIYCIGKQRGKPDNLEKWMNIQPKKLSESEAFRRRGDR